MKEGVAGCLLIIGAIAFVGVAVGAVWFVMTCLIFWSWNLAVAPLFGLVAITMWQSFAFLVLGTIIGGFFKSTSKGE